MITIIKKIGDNTIEIDVDYMPERPAPMASSPSDPNYYDDGDPEVFDIEAIRVNGTDIMSFVYDMDLEDSVKERAYKMMTEPQKHGAEVL